MATNINYHDLFSLTVTDDEDVLEGGFHSATFKNIGEDDATISVNTNEWTIPSGEEFSIPFVKEDWLWNEVTIDATGTVVECVYF
jgi:hypothetical protein